MHNLLVALVVWFGRNPDVERDLAALEPKGRQVTVRPLTSLVLVAITQTVRSTRDMSLKKQSQCQCLQEGGGGVKNNVIHLSSKTAVGIMK